MSISTHLCHVWPLILVLFKLIVNSFVWLCDSLRHSKPDSLPHILYIPACPKPQKEMMEILNPAVIQCQPLKEGDAGDEMLLFTCKTHRSFSLRVCSTIYAVQVSLYRAISGQMSGRFPCVNLLAFHSQH